MTRSRSGLWALALVVGVGGCVRRNGTPPPETWVELAGHRAPARPWVMVDDLCAVDPALFTGEQQAMTTLLAEWLGRTSAAVDGAWDDEHVALYERGVEVLPPALEMQKAALARTETAGCAFEGLGPAKELNAQARRRVTDAEAALPAIRARLALAKWKDARPAADAAARQERCPKKPKPGAPVVYFAAEDEAARLEWRFCDGALVYATPGNAPAFEPAPAPRPPKKAPDGKKWLEAAAAYPAEQVSRAPKLPRKRLARNAGDPEPDEAP